MKSSCIGLFGGNFDPIHNGHLAVANQLIEKLPLEQIQLIPVYCPPHRNLPITSAKDRIEMIKRAITPFPHLTLNDIEVRRKGTSYTIDTLESLHLLLPNKIFCLILGMDAFLNFNHWHKYKMILSNAHLIVVNRPSYSLSTEKWIDQLLETHLTENSNDLMAYPSGKILFQQLSSLSISATEIRHDLSKNNYAVLKELLPKTVLKYIMTNKLYQEPLDSN